MHLVKRQESDVISELETLLSDARQGKIVGIAYVAVCPGHDFEVASVGETERVPMLTLGALEVLKGEILSKVDSKP